MQVSSAAMLPSASSSTSSTTTPIHSNRPLSVKTAPAPLASTSESDPHRSWIFFPPSAAYIPHAPDSTSPATSPTASVAATPSSPPRHTSPQLAPAGAQTLRRPSTNIAKSNMPSSTPTTHHRILDHCFHVSIETRLKQAEAQYLASMQEQAVEQQIKEQERLHQAPMSALHQDSWRRRQRTLVDEAVVLGRKGSNVEAIVDGILKSHRSSGPLQNLPRHLKHRLHLCQLTSMVFGRFDVASSTNNSAGLNIYSAFHSRRHGASRAAIQHHLTNNAQGQKTRAFFAQSIQSSSYCRRHHRKDCQRTCCTLAKMQQQQQRALEQKKMTGNYHLNNVHKPDRQRVAGLVDAIPAFLKCSGMSYTDIARSMVEKGEHKELSDTRVFEGWYRLLLEMMTQAVIESFLCDGTVGVDTILDVFSYGDDPDTEVDPKDVVVDESASRSPAGVENLQSQPSQGQPARFLKQQSTLQDTATQDHQEDILFFNTSEYEAFKKVKEERLQELLTWNGKSLEQHFVSLAAKYPLIVFERQMTHYIARSQKLLVDPKLSRSAEEIGFLIPPATSAYADGSLSMPVSDGEDDDDEMEEVSRLEEIREEEEVTSAARAVEERHQEQQQHRVRHEKMRLATITTSVKDDVGPTIAKSKSNDRAQHLPSPPPSVVASRSSTVSPSTSIASMSEEDSIAEAARILMSNKKHRYSDIRSEPHEDIAAAKLAKKIKV